MNLDSLSLDELNQLLRQTENASNKNNNLNNVQNVATPSQRSKTRSFAEGALDTATLGFAPKAIAAVGAPILQALRPDLFGDQSYEDVYKNFRDYSRNEMAQSQETNPISYGLGGVLGAAVLPFPTNTVKGAAGLGAAYGAASGLGANDTGEAFTLNRNDALSALGGGALGGIAGGLTQGIANKFFGKKTLNPSVEERLGLSEKFNVPLTKGEALQSEKELLKEESAIRGRLGGDKAQSINAFNEARFKQYKETAQDLVSKFAGGKEFTEKGGNIGEAVNKLVDKAIQERSEYSKLYQAAKDNVGELRSKDFNDFIKNATRDLENNFITSDNVPAVYNELNALSSKINNSPNINVKQLEAWRQGLNRVYRGTLKSGDEQAAFALNEVKNKFDGFMDGVIDNAIDSNNTTLLNQLKDARSLAAEWFGKYSTQNKQEYGKRFVQDVINNKRNADNPYTNEQIVNKIFGASELGFKPESAAIVKELKKLMPEQDFNDIKLEAAQKLIEPLLKNTPNVITYKNNLDKFIKSNPTLAKELFGAEQLKDLKDLGELGRLLFTRQKGAINPSGTAAVILDYLKNNKYTGWLSNLLTKVETDQNAIRQSAMERAPANLNFGVKGAVLSGIQPSSNISTAEDFKTPQTNLNTENVNLDNLSLEELQSLLQNLEPSNNQNQNSVLNKIAQIESGNNPNAKNPNSSASGLFQLTNDTWRNLKRKYNLSGDKNDPNNQRVAAEYLLQENRSILQNAIDREPTDGELYMAHFLGGPEAAKLIQNKDSTEIAARVFPKAAKANKSIFFANGKPLTLKQVYQKLNNLI